MRPIIPRFYLYSIFKNLRFADPFLILYFMDLGLSYTGIGLLLSLQHLVTVLLELPSGILADFWGRRRATALCFLFYSAAFVGFAVTGDRTGVALQAWLGVCLTLFAMGEALRTGSHKAIMLDYLDSTGQSDMATDLIGRTRSVSKATSATAAICGGLLLAWFQDYASLFFLSAAAALCGWVLLMTYPRDSEGDAYRQRQPDSAEPGLPPRQALREMWERPMFWAVISQSVVFESQLKIILKYFTQPFLKVGLGLFGIPIIAPAGVSEFARSGAVWIGLNEFVRDSLGSFGARISPNFERHCGDRHLALNRVYFCAVLAVTVLALCALNLKWGLLPALLVLSVLTILQNLRRPIFVSALNDQIAQTHRASILSLESVARAVTVAVLLPLFGLAADHFGLVAVWLLSLLILTMGLLFPVRQRKFAP